MNKDGIFAEAVKSCKKEITEKVIAELVVSDKTKTIKKYLNSYGMRQLALHLQELGRKGEPPKELAIKFANEKPLNNGMPQFKVKFREPQPLGAVTGRNSTAKIDGLYVGGGTYSSSIRPYPARTKPANAQKKNTTTRKTVPNLWPSYGDLVAPPDDAPIPQEEIPVDDHQLDVEMEYKKMLAQQLADDLIAMEEEDPFDEE